jgi:two-component sensor histidine kinase
MAKGTAPVTGTKDHGAPVCHCREGRRATACTIGRDASNQFEEIVVTASGPHPLLQERILLRELNYRVQSGLASVIGLVSAAVVRAECAHAKAALGEVVELLHGHAELHQALAKPEREALINAAGYVRKIGCAMRRSVLDRMSIQLAFATQCLVLEAERSWRLGLIVHGIVASAAAHACFDGRMGQIKIKLTRIGAIVNCVIADNGSRTSRRSSNREFRVSSDLAKGLGGRIERGFGSEFTSTVLSFPLTEREWQANGAMMSRRTAPSRFKETAFDETADDLPTAAFDRGSRLIPSTPGPETSDPGLQELVPLRRTPDLLGAMLSPSYATDAP